MLSAIKQVDRRKCKSLEAKDYAEKEYTEKIQKELEKTVWFTGGCNSWYKIKEGKIVAMFPGFTFVYRFMPRKAKGKHHIFSLK